MPNPYQIKLSNDPSVIEIHTSDRQNYKRCRRKFEWGSTIRDNLIRIGPDQANFFLGSGFHFAMEDFHGRQRFDHPALAFAAYYDAQKKADLPDDADDLLELAVGMLTYYAEDWLPQWPEPWETLVIGGVPQVEVEVAIDLTELIKAEIGEGGFFDEITQGKTVVYVTTFDKVVIDQHERIYPLDYKTAAVFDELNLQTNPQAGAYDWSADLFYTPLGYKVEGMIWQQHKKAVPEAPKLVNIGKKNEGFSTDARQHTTYRLYKRAVTQHYGGETPPQYAEILGMLGNAQDDNGDRYVRRDILRRNSEQRRVQEEQLIAEVLEMLDPELPIYPNFTKDCSWDCPFKTPCMVKDDGGDFEHVLTTEYAQWQGYKDDWRKRVRYPDAVAAT